MRKRKSKHKELGQEMHTVNIFHKCLVVSEEFKKNKLTEIIGLLEFRTFKYTGKKKCDKSHIQQPR